MPLHYGARTGPYQGKKEPQTDICGHLPGMVERTHTHTLGESHRGQSPEAMYKACPRLALLSTVAHATAGRMQLPGS